MNEKQLETLRASDVLNYRLATALAETLEVDARIRRETLAKAEAEAAAALNQKRFWLSASSCTVLALALSLL